MAEGAEPLVVSSLAAVPADPEPAPGARGPGVVEPPEVGLAPRAPTAATTADLPLGRRSPVSTTQEHNFCEMRWDF